MHSARKLVLKQERLTELTSDDLRSLAAGAPPNNTKTCPDYTYYCITGPAWCDRITNTLTCP